MSKAIFFLYTIFILLFIVFTYIFTDANFLPLRFLYTGYMYTHTKIVSVIYIGFILGFFAFYIHFLSQIYKKKISKRQIKLLIGISFLLFFSYPTILSSDIFNYYSSARVTYFYKENPYLVMPIEFTGDQMLLFTRAANKVYLYGPTWIVLSGIPYIAGIGNILATVFVFKFLNTLFYVGTVGLIYALSRKNLFNTLFFALNPLVLIEIFVSGHNDLAMMFLALLSYYFLQQKKIVLALLCIVLSIGVKFATIFLLPVFLYEVISILKGKSLDMQMQKVWLWSGILLGVIFCLSPLREELYPWYALWLLPFVSLYENKAIKIVAAALCFGLLLSYVPFMFTGTYNFPIPLFKYIFAILPPVLAAVILLLKRKKYV